MVLIQNWAFLVNLDRENLFYDILERKNVILGYKKTKLKSPKNEIFPKGLVHGFGPKKAIFLCFFIRNIDQESVFCYILEQKKTSFYAINKRS